MRARFPALTLAVVALTAAPSWGQQDIALTLEAGRPLLLALEKKTPIRVGEPIRAVLQHPLYVFDRVVLPQGTVVMGKVTEVERPSGAQRAKVYARGRVRIAKRALVEFDRLLLPGGREMKMATSAAPGAPAVVRLGAPTAGGKLGSGRLHKASEALQQSAPAQAFRAASSNQKGKELKKAGSSAWQGIRNSVLAYWPFGEQNLRPGASFTAVLDEPLSFGEASVSAEQLAHLGEPPPLESVLHARLLGKLDSGDAKVGDPVRAVVTQPLLSADGHLLVPEGSRLEGEVTQVRQARRFARDGQLRFRLTRVELPSGVEHVVRGDLRAADAQRGTRIQIDDEGGAIVAASRKRFIAPAIAVAAVWTGPSGLDNPKSQGVAPGWSGFGLIGTAAALSTRAAAAPLGIWGAANSVYFNLIKRADELVFPAHTRFEIQLGRTPGAADVLQPAEALPQPAEDSRAAGDPERVRLRPKR